MDLAAIPSWNPQGVLPPVDSADSASVNRSPYRVSIIDIILHFGTTPRRRTILSGFLAFRITLQSTGLTQGFQWIDGSFLENIEMIEKRDPDDVDVVTFYHLPMGQTQENLYRTNPGVFDHARIKDSHHVDAYFVQLNQKSPESLVSKSTYWYSMWSRRRNDYWKGYLQVNFDSYGDITAKNNLEAIVKNGGGL